MQTQPILQSHEIHRALPLGGQSLHILRGISFEIQRGEWVALTGPSGSGKSTLLGILAGIDLPTAGEVRLNGMDLTRLSEGQLAHLRNRQIGIVFQSFNLIPSMTAQENVEAPLYIGPQRRQARQLAQEMLELVGLGDRLRHLPHQLSGGEQQRVAIARALVTRPAVLLADEPTGNLDTATGEKVLRLIARLRGQFGLTVVMVTHDPSVASFADRSLHLVDGKLQPAASDLQIASTHSLSVPR
jgi:putative ABC transport system ATP-binding protein